MRFTSALLVLTATLAAHQIDTASAASVRGTRRANANTSKLSRRQLKKGGDKGTKSEPNNYAFGTTAATGPATPITTGVDSIADVANMAGAGGAVVADQQGESSASSKKKCKSCKEAGNMAGEQAPDAVDIGNYAD